MTFHLSLSFLGGSLLFGLLLELEQYPLPLLARVDDSPLLVILTYNKGGRTFVITIKLNTSFPLYKPKEKLKFIAPRSELTPDKCRPNIAKSTLAPL
jgi:hypothetical protein